MDNIELKSNPVNVLLQEIESDILALLKENAELKERIKELLQAQTSTTVNRKIIILEEELRKLKKTVTELQNQEDNSRERINQLRKIIQEELSAPQAKVKAEDFGPKVTKSAVSKNKMGDIATTYTTGFDNTTGSILNELNETNTQGLDEGQVGYSPYITDEEPFSQRDRIGNQGAGDPKIPKDPIGYEFFEDDITSGQAQNTEEEELPNYREFTPDAPKEIIAKTLAQKPSATIPGYNKTFAERPKISLGKNSNAFLIRESDQEEDPFAIDEREEQLEDDDFFKLNNKK